MIPKVERVKVQAGLAWGEWKWDGHSARGGQAGDLRSGRVRVYWRVLRGRQWMLEAGFPSSSLLSRASNISQTEVLGLLPAGKFKLLHLIPVINLP